MTESRVIVERGDRHLVSMDYLLEAGVDMETRRFLERDDFVIGAEVGVYVGIGYVVEFTIMDISPVSSDWIDARRVAMCEVTNIVFRNGKNAIGFNAIFDMDGHIITGCPSTLLEV